MPVKEELDRAVPPHDLLDVSANKSKAELANRGGLANRQLPTSGKKSGGLSNSSSVSLNKLIAFYFLILLFFYFIYLFYLVIYYIKLSV